MKDHEKVILAFGLIGALAACNSAALPPTTAIATPIALPAPPFNSPRTQTADVVIRPAQNTSARVSVGQTITVTRPEDYDEWQVDFDVATLRALTPPEKMRAPGLQGWLFHAIKSGETRIMLTSLLPPCSKAVPCPHLNPQRFVITLQVQP